MAASFETRHSSWPARILAALPVVVFAYVAASFLLHPQSWILLGNLPDPDDYMYLNQIADWLGGQGWFDNIQHRLDPPGGVAIAFTRISELPMAALAVIFNLFLPWPQAAILMAALWPQILLAVLLLALMGAAEPYMEKRWTRLTAFFLLFASYFLFQFSPGHIDHHNLTALLALVAAGVAARMMLRPESALWPVAGGVCQAYGLAVALEYLPPLILISGWIGLWAIARGKDARRAAILYGIAFLLATLGFLAITVPPGAWGVMDPLVFSPVYAVFAAALALQMAGIALLAPLRPPVRWIGTVLLAAMLGAAFLVAFPAMATGPYGAMNADLAKLMFGSISEARPIVRPGVTAPEISLRLLWPLMALAAGVVLGVRARGIGRWPWGMMILLLAAHLALAAFYQIRFMVLAQAFSIIPLTAAVAKAYEYLALRETGWRRALLGAWLLFIAAPLPMLVLPALVTRSPLYPDLLLFPVVFVDLQCDMQSLAGALNQNYGDHPRRIMNEMASGPELLYRTPHTVLGAPFHTNVEGNLSTGRFFAATDPATALSEARARGAELVVLCRKLIPHYQAGGASPSFAAQLDAGHIPGWLKPIPYTGAEEYLLFEVLPGR